MSAFIVSAGTMDRIMSAALRYPNQITDAHPDFTMEARDATEFGRRLFRLNRAALLARYGAEVIEDEGLEEIRHYTYVEPPLVPSHMVQNAYSERRNRSRQCWLLDSYNATRCLQYQCAEGDIPSSDEFKLVTLLCYLIADDLVHSINPPAGVTPWNSNDAPWRGEVAPVAKSA